MALNFEYFKNVNFEHRYVNPEKLYSYLTEHYKNELKIIGKSFLGNPIYQFSIGNGPVNILAWSQMHGNESTGTLAMLDLLYSLEQNPEQKTRLFKGLSLDFIFLLNPDGAKKWTRRNAVGIDINRDYKSEASPEIRILKKAIKTKNYEYALNLHDQRTVFTTDGVHPATLSFLSPSFDKARNLNEHRKQSMAIISHIFSSLRNQMGNRIGRYSDEFYPTSVGDNLMQRGISSILFEAGHWEDDYLRTETRKYFTFALYYALGAISMIAGQTYNYDLYFDIPENQETHVDIIYHGLRLKTDVEITVDVAIKFREEIKKGKEEISFVPVVTEIGDLQTKKAWQEVDASDRVLTDVSKFPEIDKEFSL